MADRYLVGSPGSWSASNTAIWSTASGGTSGASVPTASDNVFIDGNSGGGTVTLTATANCLNFNCTGFTGTLALGTRQLRIAGSTTLGAAMTITASLGYFRPNAASGSVSFTSNGVTIPQLNMLLSASATLTLQDALSVTGAIIHTDGAFNTNGKAVSCSLLSWTDPGTLTSSLTLGASTITLTGSGTGASAQWQINFGSNSFAADTSTIIFSNTGSRQFGNQDIDTGGDIYASIDPTPVDRTYHNVQFAAGGSVQFHNSNTFNSLQFGQGTAVTLTGGTTQTVGNLVATGASGSLITLGSRTTLQHHFSKGSGTVSLDWLSLSYSDATGGASWSAGGHSVDAGSNTGWAFLPDEGSSAEVVPACTQSSTGSLWVAGAAAQQVPNALGTSSGEVGLSSQAAQGVPSRDQSLIATLVGQGGSAAAIPGVGQIFLSSSTVEGASLALVPPLAQVSGDATEASASAVQVVGSCPQALLASLLDQGGSASATIPAVGQSFVGSPTAEGSSLDLVVLSFQSSDGTVVASAHAAQVASCLSSADGTVSSSGEAAQSIPPLAASTAASAEVQSSPSVLVDELAQSAAGSAWLGVVHSQTISDLAQIATDAEGISASAAHCTAPLVSIAAAVLGVGASGDEFLLSCPQLFAGLGTITSESDQVILAAAQSFAGRTIPSVDLQTVHVLRSRRDRRRILSLP
jgi:hypothetical protein